MKVKLIKGLPESYGRYLFVLDDGSVNEGLYDLDLDFTKNTTRPGILFPDYFTGKIENLSTEYVIGYLDFDLYETVPLED
jgi:hypothetical protein